MRNGTPMPGNRGARRTVGGRTESGGIGAISEGTVSAVIVNWNTRDALAECLGTLIHAADALPIDFVVVDNASTDGSAEMVTARFPDVRLVRNAGNLGFATAVNIGLRLLMEESRADYFLLLNPDVVVQPDGVRALIRHMENRPDAGVCGPALRLPEGGFQPGAGGFLPSVRTAFVHFFFLSRVLPKRRRPLFLNQAAFAAERRAVEVQWLSGACLLARRRALEEVGLLDERYFLYAEDMEWCARMVRRGWRVHYLPRAAAVHAHGLASRTEGSAAERRQVDVRWLDALFDFTAGDLGCVGAAAVRVCAAAGFLLRAAGYGLAGLTCGGRMVHRGKAVVMFRYFLRSLGA